MLVTHYVISRGDLCSWIRCTYNWRHTSRVSLHLDMEWHLAKNSGCWVGSTKYFAPRERSYAVCISW